MVFLYNIHSVHFMHIFFLVFLYADKISLLSSEYLIIISFFSIYRLRKSELHNFLFKFKQMEFLHGTSSNYTPGLSLLSFWDQSIITDTEPSALLADGFLNFSCPLFYPDGYYKWHPYCHDLWLADSHFSLFFVTFCLLELYGSPNAGPKITLLLFFMVKTHARDRFVLTADSLIRYRHHRSYIQLYCKSRGN